MKKTMKIYMAAALLAVAGYPGSGPGKSGL